MSLRVLTWNVEWAAPGSSRTTEILSRIEHHRPELVCLTETNDKLLAQNGHCVSSRPDYGYPIKAGRRKVMLWSREPWEQVDDLGIGLMPPGRFVSGVTQTSLGKIRVVGVCIPWFGSRAESRRGQERKTWRGDHEQYLVALAEVLGQDSSEDTIVMGDFNQIVGLGSRVPVKLQLALRKALRGMTIATAGLEFQEHQSIDHITLSVRLGAESVSGVSNTQGAKRLSDHFGVVADLYRRVHGGPFIDARAG